MLINVGRLKPINFQLFVRDFQEKEILTFMSVIAEKLIYMEVAVKRHM